MYIEMFWTFPQSYKMLLFHIKIKSHIGKSVTVKEINRIFFLYKYKHLNKIHFNAHDKDFKTYRDCYKQN